jgi:3-hydroxyisobutyrate dehydrogenase-like beta-hydroxyacid dehydrogenase
MLDLARSSGTDPSFPEMLQKLFERAEAAGLGDHDLSAMIQLFRARH